MNIKLATKVRKIEDSKTTYPILLQIIAFFCLKTADKTCTFDQKLLKKASSCFLYSVYIILIEQR
ncbi:hypothetical protein EG346_17830 [Chryseobacterium carnipullorum]|uniref:Uncharacterized protein n=1 Tax=Chryseobacterium carnipullorum TaxID=1124835 RepID=A0A3G6M8S2_CHRCU|nr:hypothetical protein EG346_17830 [Chryseobacterium carnipullorum]AZA64801.1 hypothetical protein EG345_08855 [Chryseobacterium carnipullorum]